MWMWIRAGGTGIRQLRYEMLTTSINEEFNRMKLVLK